MELGSRHQAHTPPPSYDEVVRETVGPPPIYTERDETRTTRPAELQNPAAQSSNGDRNRVVSTAWTEQSRVVVTQPTSEVNRRTSTSQVTIEQTSNREQKKSYSCNCFCVACKWKPCSSDGECFCYNCILFVMYAITCGPGLCSCVVCKKICPETFSDCPTRDSSMMDSYTFRNDNFGTRCCWACCGPICCLSCDEHADVCPLATPCEEIFGMKCIRKMTCYCGGSERSQCTVNLMDEHACGFIWDCKQCGFKSH